MSINRSLKNIVSIRDRLFIFAVLLIVMFGIVAPRQVGAADYPKLNNRSLTVGSTVPGAVTTYAISWRYPAPTTIGSVRLEVCDSGFIDDVCVNPSADLSSASLTSQIGITGFSILSQSAGEILLTRAASAASTVQSTYTFDSVANPSGLQSRFYIRISTYATSDGTGSFNHFSSVASATAEPIVITTEVPPILFFCAALTINEWCESASGNYIDYGDLTPFVTEVAVSQFGVATNASGGYVVTVNGDTMTSGNKVIDAISIPTANTPGIAQFGLNLRANTDPATGQDVFGEGIGTVAADYDTPDLFKFNDGDTVASAVTGTLFNTFTVTYIVNIDPDQPSGVYNTTVAYICTAAF